MKEKKDLIFDLLFIAVLFCVFFPIAKWFYLAQPPMGLDFYQFPSYVRFVSDHLAFPPVSWKYTWFGGVPLITDYSCLFFYVAIPFAKIWGLVMGSKVFLLVMSFLYFVFAYLFLKEVSKSRWFALAAAIGLMWTTNFYSPMTSGGNVTYAATQAFATLVFWLIVKYFHTNNKSFFFLAILFAGLSYWGHAGTALIFVSIPSALFLMFWIDRNNKLISFKKIKETFFYSVVSMSIGFLPLYAIAYLVLTIPKAANFNFFQEGGIVHLTTIKGLIITQNFFFIAGILMLLLLVVARIRQKGINRFVPFLMLVFYIIGFELLYVLGRNPFAGGIMPPRTFWFFTLTLAGLAAISWNFIFNSSINMEVTKFEKKVKMILQIVILIVIFFSPLATTIDLNKRVFQTHLDDVGVATNFHDYAVAQSTLEQKLVKNNFSLEVFNVDNVLAKKNFTAEDINRLKGHLIPEWLDTEEVNYRFHTLEVGVNIWWSALFKIPITHGSYNSAHVESNNYAYWTDTAFHGELTTHWAHPLEINKNDLLFLIDWEAIKYLLGNEVEVKDGTDYSLNASIIGPSSVATFLTEDPNLVDLKGIKDSTLSGDINFFRINQAIVSPIIKTTNAPTVLIVGDPLTAYDNFLRNIAHLNLNSRYLVPVKGLNLVNRASLEELKKFDVIFMQYYLVNPEAWKKLEMYVNEGGNLIIDTGSEVKESSSNGLPNVFPIKETVRSPLGVDWKLTSTKDEPLLKDVDTQNFGQLKYGDEPWNLSHAENSSVKDWARVILSQDNKPILVAGALGKGKVVWSGFNLSYHYNRYFSASEGQLLKNILGSMMPLVDEHVLDFKMERPQPEKIIVEGNSFKGVVFKENNYGGWSAEMVTPYKKSLPVYNAGLNYHYVQLPDDVKGPAKIELKYRGTLFNWLFFILAVFVGCWLIMKATIPQNKINIFGKINLFGSIKTKIAEKVDDWWYTDD